MDGAPAARGDFLRGHTIVFLVTEDWYFCSHRLPVARAARDAGADVVVATRIERHRDAIEREGFRVVELPWRRRSRGLWDELRALVRIVRLYRSVRPSIVHHVAVKAAVYGGIAAMLSRHPAQVNAIAGLGYVSTSSQARARLLRPLVQFVFSRIVNRPETRVIVQNRDDAEALVSGRLFDRDRIVVVRGSGVDVDRFRPAACEPAGAVRAVVAARMLWSKGIDDVVGAARLLRERDSRVRIVLCGDPDPENPESIEPRELQRWHDDGLVEWRGHQDDMATVWRGAHVGLLPSRREGLPMALLEAAACGLPLVATDVPGCREIVVDGDNGLLVPSRDPSRLADALETLAHNGDLRRRMGARSRELVEAHFAESAVVRGTLDIYREIVDGGTP